MLSNIFSQIFNIWAEIKILNPTWLGLGVVISFMITGFNQVAEMWGYILAKLAGLVLNYNAASTVIDGLSFVNSFFPLTEALAMMTAYSAALLASVTIRIIKSFIPTIG